MFYQEADLPGQIERITGIPRLEILHRLGESLRLPVAQKLALPTAETFNHLGTSFERLKEINLLPKPSRSGELEFYTATPGAIRHSIFSQATFTLALQSDIDAAWDYLENIDSATSATIAISERLLTSIALLVSQCSSVGGEEIFLGHPNPTSYEFVARSKHYRGSISPYLVDDLLKILKDSRSQSLSLDIPGCEQITIGFVSGVDRGVLIIHWTALVPLRKASRETSIEPTIVLDPAKAPPHQQTPLNSPVLVIDDDERFAAILCGLLQSHGLETKRCASAGDALCFLGAAQVSVKLIILDLHLGDTIASDVLPQLRRMSVAPVLLVTSEESVDREIELIEKGADGYVRKSADPELLFAWCTNLISKSREGRLNE